MVCRVPTAPLHLDVNLGTVRKMMRRTSGDESQFAKKLLLLEKHLPKKLCCISLAFLYLSRNICAFNFSQQFSKEMFCDPSTPLNTGIRRVSPHDTAEG